jgi:hypothetical protein
MESLRAILVPLVESLAGVRGTFSASTFFDTPFLTRRRGDAEKTERRGEERREEKKEKEKGE